LELRLTPEPFPRSSALSLWLIESMAATTRMTMKAIPAPVRARSKRGGRELPPEAKIRTPKKTTTAQKAENMSGPLTEVRRLRGAPGFCCANVISSCSQRGEAWPSCYRYCSTPGRTCPY